MTDNALKDTYDYIIYILYVAFHPSVFKALFAIGYIMFSFMFDVQQGPVLLALFMLVLMDFMSGIAAARYNDEPIRSSKIKHTAIKLTAYFAIISGAHLAELGITHYLTVIDETVTAFFLLTELISLLENAGRMGVDTPKGLLSKLLDYKNKL